MEQISAYMDGESGDQEAAALARLKHDAELRRAWDTYHLIGESLRGETPNPRPEFMSRFSAALAQEPTVLAPRAPVARRGLPRIALPLAASFGGVALVAWLALSNNPLMPGKEPVAANSNPPAVADAKADDAARDYIMAHQGEVSYVRTVSARAADMR